MTARDWRIVRTMRLSEDRMKVWLERVGALGFETYYPKISELKRVPRRKLSHAQRDSGIDLMRHRVVPFLPQLVFTRMTAPTARLLDVPGCIGFLCVGSEPARIADTLIERLREREAANDGAIPGATPAEFIFEPGDQVRVLNGPFAMFNGTVEQSPCCKIEDIDAESRLRLTIDIFGRATPIEIAVADVAHV